MTTAHLIIVCATVLVGTVIAARTLREHHHARAQLQRETAMHERGTAAAAGELADAVSALTTAAAAIEAAAPQHGPSRLGHRVTVHTKQPDDQTLFGVVVGDYVDRIALDDAEYVTAAGPRPLPGRQDIATKDIAWLDVHALVTVPDAAPTRAEA